MRAAAGRSELRGARIARAAILLMLIPLAAYVLYAVSKSRRPSAPAAPTDSIRSGAPSSEMKEFHFEQTQGGKLLYSLKAGRFLGTEDGVNILEGIESFEIHRPDGVVTVSARHGRFLMTGSKLTMAELVGEVVVRSEAGERLEAPSARYSEPEKTVTASGPVRFKDPTYSGEGSAISHNLETGSLELSGPVTLRCDRGPLAGWTGRAAKLTRAATGQATVLSGGVNLARNDETITTDELRLVKAPPADSAVFERNVSGSLRGTTMAGSAGGATAGPGPSGKPATGKGAEPVTFSAGRMEVVRSDPEGPARATLTGKPWIDGAAEDGPVRMEAPEILIDFDAGGSPSSVTGRSGATLRQRTDEGVQEIRSQLLELSIASATVKDGTATGDVHVSGPDGEAHGEQARFATDRMLLFGGRPWARQGERLVVADLLDSDRKTGLMHATGKVRVKTAPRSAEKETGPVSALPGIASGKPVHIESNEATFQQKEQQASFRGRVRAWQDESSLQADNLDVREKEGSAHAWGSVVTRGVRQPAPAQRIAYAITAPEMFYSNETREVRYTSGASYAESGSSLRADEIRALQAAGGSMEAVHAFGNVEFISGTRRGKGDLADYLVKERKLTLIGTKAPATLDDESEKQHFRAPALTVDLEADTIAVASETGERGRVTLRKAGQDGTARKR